MKKKNSERVLCQAVLLSLECLTRNPRETLPCALGFRAGSVPESLAHITFPNCSCLLPCKSYPGVARFLIGFVLRFRNQGAAFAVSLYSPQELQSVWLCGQATPSVRLWHLFLQEFQFLCWIGDVMCPRLVLVDCY